MGPFGFTRSAVESDHALICADSHVSCALSGWSDTAAIVLISPEIGSAKRARFMQYLAQMPAGATAEPPAGELERAVYVLDGKLTLTLNSESNTMTKGGFAFLPADSDYRLRAVDASRVNVFEKRYQPVRGASAPQAIVGQEQDLRGEPFMGDEDAVLKVLLPTDESFDLAMNVFTFKPGAALPLVEVHVMEHGLLMLEGSGIYRLSDRWYPVQEGDAIWMASYCPQWFAAVGKSPARYLYYKDVNRHSLESS